MVLNASRLGVDEIARDVAPAIKSCCSDGELVGAACKEIVGVVDFVGIPKVLDCKVKQS